MLLKWRDDYSTGVDLFDQEHQRMLQMINLVFTSIQHGHEARACERVINEMIAYTGHHFVHEEELMQRYSYPDEASHKKQHMELSAHIEGFSQRLGKGEGDLVKEIHTFLRQWFLEHILEQDKLYGPFFAGKDLSLEQPVKG